MALGFVVTVDPGSRRCGCAVWFDAALVDAAEPVGASPEDTARACVRFAEGSIVRHGGSPSAGPRQWVVEDPQTYDMLRVTDGNLEQLRSMLAYLTVYRSDTTPSWMTKVYPAQWKGQVPKKTHQSRVVSSLTVQEARIVAELTGVRWPKDAVDAIGIGLWFHGRQKRGGRPI